MKPMTADGIRNAAQEFCRPLLESSPYQRMQWLVLTVVFSAACFGAMYIFYANWSIGLDFQTIKCMDGTVFLVEKKKPYPQKGKLFAIRAANAEPVLKDGQLLAKYVRGVPGDVVSISADEVITVNGEVVAKGMPHLHGLNPKQMNKFFGTRTLGQDEYWMMGVKPLSFDSRYYGPVKLSQFQGEAHVLF